MKKLDQWMRLRIRICKFFVKKFDLKTILEILILKIFYLKFSILKLIQGHGKLELFRNSYINLALPFFQSSEPMPVMKNSVNLFYFKILKNIILKNFL